MSWPDVALGVVCDVRRGTTITQTQTRKGIIPVVAGGLNATYCHDTPNRQGNVVTISASGANAGFVNFWSSPIFASDCSTVETDGVEAEIKFVYYFLRSKQEYINSKLRSGAAQPHVYAKDIALLQLPLPPLPEQRRIAAILDQADALRAKRREALAQLDSLTQSIFIEMFGDPRGNPKGWLEVPVGELTNCIVPGRDKPKSFSGGTPWVTTANLIHLGTTLPLADSVGLNRFEIEEVRAKVIPAGSVVISCVGDLGVVSLAGVPMVINQQLHSFQCSDKLNNLFLMYCLGFQKAYMLAKASSTTLPYMNKSVCNSIPVIAPPIANQKAFATRIQSVEALKATHNAALQELDRLIASLQQRAFQGEL